MKTKRKCSKAQLAALAKGRAKLARMRSQKGGSSSYDPINDDPINDLTGQFCGLSLKSPVVETQPTTVGREVKKKSPGTRVSPCCAAVLGAAAAGYGSVNTKGPFAYPVQTRPLNCEVMGGYVPMNIVPTFLENPYDDIEILQRLCGPSVRDGGTCRKGRQGVVFYKPKDNHPCAVYRFTEKNKLVLEKPKEKED